MIPWGGLFGLALAGTPTGGVFEAELRQGFRLQRVAAQITPTILGYQETIGIPAEARFRLSTSERRVGIEMWGGLDGLAAAVGARPERWGGLRAVLGGAGLTPLTVTTAHARLGVQNLDVRFLGEPEHTGIVVGSVGAELRRYTNRRMQHLEADVLIGEAVLGATARAGLGFAIGDTGWYATLGASTSRLWEIPPDPVRDLLMITHQVETSMLFAPRLRRRPGMAP